MPAQLVVIQARDSNGDPVSGAKFYTYAAGTSTPQAVYSDNALSTSVSNPVVCDSYGRTAVWMDSDLTYKFALKTSDDATNLIPTIDNYTPRQDDILYLISVDTATALTAAQAAQAAAETAQAAAETAETNAETAETNAETAETNAASSATAAASSATAAATSATSSATSATASAASATTASTAATNAGTAQTAAETAQTAAETAQGLAEAAASATEGSAASAATSATAASTSATAADASADEALARLAATTLAATTALGNVLGPASIVISSTTLAQPASPSNGDTYLLPSSGTLTGTNWSGFTNGYIARYMTNGGWFEDAPAEGWRVYDQSTDKYFLYNGSAWQVSYGDPQEVELKSTNTGAVNLAALEAARDRIPNGLRGQIIIKPNYDSGSLVIPLSTNFSEGSKRVELFVPKGMTFSGGTVSDVEILRYDEGGPAGRVVYTLPTTDPGSTQGRREGSELVQVNHTGDYSIAGRWFYLNRTGANTTGDNEIATVTGARWDDVTGATALWAEWIYAFGPLHESSGLTGAPSGAQSFTLAASEINPQNRYADHGYYKEPRLVSNRAIGVQVIPETQDFTGTLGTNRRGYHALAGVSVGGSLYTNTDNNETAKSYNAYHVGVNAVAPNGRGMLFMGHKSHVVSASVDTAGTGYVVGDVLTVAGGTGRAATLEVTAIGGSGDITTVRPQIPGEYSVDPTLSANSVTGGTGSGAAIDLTMSTSGAASASTDDPYAVIEADEKWQVGVDFRLAEFTGQSGVYASGYAAMFKDGHWLIWENAAASVRAKVLGSVSDGVRIGALDSTKGIGFYSANHPGQPSAFVDTTTTSPTCYVGLVGSTTAATVQAYGTGTDVDLLLDGKGAGLAYSNDAVKAPRFGARTVSIADDNVLSIALGSIFSHKIYIILNSATRRTSELLLHNTAIVSIDATNITNLTSRTDLTGTTGTDGAFTVAVAAAANNLLLENRLGVAATATVIILGPTS